MWATFALLPAALDLMATWGFQYKTGGPWIKRAGNGKPCHGHRLRLAQRRRTIPDRRPGRAPDQKPRSTRNLLLTGEWPQRPEDIDSIIVDSLRREHSRKPDEIIPLTENLFDGP